MTSSNEAGTVGATMARGGLPPNLAALAAREGRDAARAVRAGLGPARCRWEANGPSLTRSRLAAVWAAAFAEELGPVRDLPE